MGKGGSLRRMVPAALLVLAAIPGIAAAADDPSGDHGQEHGHDHGHDHEFGDGIDIDDGHTVSFESVVYPMYFPIQGGSEFSDNFGDCRGSGCSRTHEGIDIMEPKMTPVLAVASGTVYWIHDDVGGNCCAFGMRHDDGWISYYIHLNNDTPGTDDGAVSGLAPGVVNGARIEAGQLVGWVGDSGNAENSGSHLHFELRKPGNIVINPYESLQAATVLNAPLGNGSPRGCDFNDDGFDDLAVGTPGEDLASNTKVDAGAVTVLYGSVDGVDPESAEMITQASAGIQGRAKAGDEFGAATACGDINGDGHDDLVVGAPGDTINGLVGAGSVTLLLGSDGGLTPASVSLWHQRRSGVPTKAAEGDRFGAAIAIGDFNGDGFGDAAIGAPGETRGGAGGAGMVTVLFGSASGFSGVAESLHENRRGVPGVAEVGDALGSSLSAGDYDGDAVDDLAIGIALEDSPTKSDSGAVVVVPGAPSGMAVSESVRVTQNSLFGGGSMNDSERFGAALVTADFDLDGKGDLAVGVPRDRVDGAAAGGVTVLYGSGSGLDLSSAQTLRQGKAGIRGASVAGDRFGQELTAGDYDGDGHHDIAVGIPAKSVAGKADVGTVAVIHGSSAGLTGDGDQVWSQDTPGVAGEAVAGDAFGHRLISGDFRGIGLTSLAVGVPLKDSPASADSGIILVLRGSGGTGITATGERRIGQGTAGVPGRNEVGDGFGYLGAIGGGA